MFFPSSPPVILEVLQSAIPTTSNSSFSIDSRVLELKSLPQAFEMDSLPVELLHLICDELEIADILSFRLASKLFANVGLKYLFEEVIVHPHQRDFERLVGIAEHSVARHNVQRIFYRPHMLEIGGRKEYKDWYAYAEESALMDAVVPIPGMRKHYPRTKAQWAAAYDAYCDMYEYQSAMLGHDLDEAAFETSLTQLPNLEKLTVDVGFIFSPKGNHHYSPFRKAIVPPTYREGTGQRELLKIMSALCRSGRKLRKFRVGLFHYDLFANSLLLERFVTTQSQTLTTLRLDMTSGDEEDLSTETEECSVFLRETQALSRFLTQFPKLQKLYVRWETWYMQESCYEVFPARFEDVIEEGKIWPDLKSFTIGAVTAKESQLLRFFEAHKSLKFLGLQTIELDEGDSWQRLLPKLQGMLTLEDALIYGRLYAPAPTLWGWGECWDIADADAFPFDDFRDEITDYMVHGGECPLNEDNMDPEAF